MRVHSDKKPPHGNAHTHTRAYIKVHTSKDWDLYCHYVAGLVGIGLSGLFSASGLEVRVRADWQAGAHARARNHMLTSLAVAQKDNAPTRKINKEHANMC